MLESLVRELFMLLAWVLAFIICVAGAGVIIFAVVGAIWLA